PVLHDADSTAHRARREQYATMGRSFARALPASGLLLACVYMAQHVTCPPNSSEGAVMMDYVHRLSEGQRLHFDFFDYYGPLAWYPYVVAYWLAGQKMIGVRVMLLLLKLVAVVLTYRLIIRLGRSFYAFLGAAVVAALLGQPWSYFQIPYASHLTFPLLLALLSALVSNGPRQYRRVALAAALTAVMLWTKVNTGMYVFVGAGLYLLNWVPVPAATSARAGRATAVFWLRIASLSAIGLGLHLFVLDHLLEWFWAYLSVPVLVLVLWTAGHALREYRGGDDSAARVAPAALYVAVTAGVWACFLLACFGRSSWDYLAEQARVLSRFDHWYPLPPLGERVQHLGFNEYHWSQLPWLVTAGFLAWILHRRRARAASAAMRLADARVAALCSVLTLHGFVLYAAADECHLIQIVLPSAACLFALLAIAQGSGQFSLRSSFAAHTAIAGVTLLTICTIVSLPSENCYRWTKGDWSSDRLAYLRFHSPEDDRLAELPIGTSYGDLDVYMDRTAEHLLDLTPESEPVLVVGGCQLLVYASDNVPAVPRYSHLLYLLRNRILRREAFIDLMPEDELDQLFEHPPRIVVLDIERDPVVFHELPELAAAIRGPDYEEMRGDGPFRIFVRRSADSLASSK
ncbi:MAG TPA: hypothetical protein VK524_02970, partial [Polyangiaceae bacterium]|nr:hypothetical protein [Polyangiaceae bacterium]